MAQVRVEGRSTKGFISFTKCNLRELVLHGVGSLIYKGFGASWGWFPKDNGAGDS
jgi:hypothetical protein